MENANKVSRRAFVSASAASIVATAASANRVLGANNRLRVGIIGSGGLAQGAHIPALMRMKETDYVDIVAPEHWHARMTLDAADAGKHIYCEKPMTWSIEQAKQVIKKIEQTR